MKKHRRLPAPDPSQARIRKHYRVEMLPEPARTLVDQGLARGKTYHQIQQEIAATGHHISQMSISRYWRNRWRPYSEKLHWVRAQVEILSQMLRQTGESDEAMLARKLLLMSLLSRMQDLEGLKVFDLLRETREMVKATRHLDTKKAAGAQPTLSPAERRRRVREIYGWPEEELEAPARGAEKANP